MSALAITHSRATGVRIDARTPNPKKHKGRISKGCDGVYVYAGSAGITVTASWGPGFSIDVDYEPGDWSSREWAVNRAIEIVISKMDTKSFVSVLSIVHELGRQTGVEGTQKTILRALGIFTNSSRHFESVEISEICLPEREEREDEE